MIYCDYHLHSTYSHDAKASAKEQIERAIALGIDEVCFTEHLEYDHLDFGYDKPYYGETDIRGYIDGIDRLAHEYRGRINIKHGLEVSLGTDVANQYEIGVMAPYMDELDFLIGSTHAMGTHPKHDPSYVEYFQSAGSSKEEVYIKYLERVLRNLTATKPFYCVMGHYDYVAKYAPISDRKMSYDIAPELFDKMLTYVIQNDVAIEINTSSFKADPSWGLDVLKRYKQLGGYFVTIGSDAHTSQNVGQRYDDAITLLQEAGIEYIATYDKMKRQLHKIK